MMHILDAESFLIDGRTERSVLNGEVGRYNRFDVVEVRIFCFRQVKERGETVKHERL